MMTAQTSKSVTDIDEIDLDASIFDSKAFRLNDEQAAIIATARKLGQNVFADTARRPMIVTPHSRPRITGICTAPACSASPFPKNTAGSAPTIKPMP